MSSELLPQLLLRFLPTVALLVMGFIAAADQRTRAQWTNLLYSIGSLKPEQQDDPQVQKSVKWPFILVALIFLIWPVRYYFHATRTLPTAAQSDLFQKAPETKAATIEAPKVVATPTPAGAAVPAPPS